ncbi:MAG: VOC family protein [Actinomycetota bacterium]|nr:VOC family protein [Actinomycetota bacterium]
MVTRNSAWPAGTPCWVDLGAEVAKAVSFYSELFGWEAQVGGPETGGYAQARFGGLAVAGIGPLMDSSQPSAWTTYLASDGIEADVAKIRAAGGQVIMDAMDVMEFGRMAIAIDPTGAGFGLWQSGTHTGFELANEPASVCWNEHMSADIEAGKRFYAEVFGYHFQDVAPEYVTFSLTEGGDAIGGMGVTGEGQAAWHTYFTVDDADATVAKVRELGGTVTAAAEDTDFGRMAGVTDDQGAGFKVIEVPAAS